VKKQANKDFASIYACLLSTKGAYYGANNQASISAQCAVRSCLLVKEMISKIKASFALLGQTSNCAEIEAKPLVALCLLICLLRCKEASIYFISKR
jgi:hypothetical protein